MAYLALYRKWRPQTFDEVVGQKHISLPLSRAVTEDRLAHAYLFSGPRGTGKTSMAKILAKAVNCEHPHGANPCNECRACREITGGSSLDVYEIDAASNRGIEEIRALKESVRSLPAVSRKKVYIIDEVHMLTKEAFNALLKTLEEPPAHVLFILATTEPEKIPLTILSRCQRYEFRRISAADIREHLLSIAEKSDFSLTSEAADLLAIRAEGGLRDALSLLDQCTSASGGKELTAETVYELLGLTGKDQLLELAARVLRKDSGGALSLFSSLLQSGKEPAAVLGDLLSHFRDVMLAKIDKNSPELLVYGNKKDALLTEAEQVSAPYLDALFESLHGSLSETKRSASPRMNAEMGLLRLCRLSGDRTLEGLLHRIEILEKKLADGIPVRETPLPAPTFTPQPPTSTPAFPRPRSAPPAPIETPPAPKIPEPPVPREIPAPEVENTPTPTPAPAPAVSLPSEKKKEISAAPLPAPNDAPAAAVLSGAACDALWQKVLAYFQSIHRLDILMCFSKSKLILASGNRAVISAPQPFIVLACNNERYKKVVEEAFLKCCGRLLTPRAVLMGSPEEAEAKAEASAVRSAAPVPPPAEIRPKTPVEGYEKISKADIPAADLENPVLAAALKITGDCDIYEKK